MDNGPLVAEEIDGGRSLIALFHSIKPIKIAFWLKIAENDFRYLYLASEEIEERGWREDYEQLIPLIYANPEWQLDPFRVKLISATDPRALAALELQSKLNIPTRIGGRRFGDVYADDAYIYPPIQPVPATAL